jgi:cytochrome d ubiquinol oxidase subunit II
VAHLYDIPMVFILVGLALYAVLAGADFGAGLWQLVAGVGETDEDAQRIREHAHHSMAPVWEANHVWLIFVLTLMWTAYPVALGSIASTLGVPLFVAGLGIIFRGAAYALRAGTASRRELRVIDVAFSISSLIAPFALGAIAGAIAARRVPVGNARGSLLGSWTGPTPLLAGVLFVVTAAYLAAVYMAADGARHGDTWLENAFRRRALGAGLVAGAISFGGLFVLHSDAHPLYHGLIEGDGLSAVIISALAGGATLALVWSRQFLLARFSAALAVAAMIAGWALAQQPLLLPHLTIRQAAAGHDTLVAVVVAVLAGAVILFPSLALLFRLTLGGSLDDAHADLASAEPVPSALVEGAGAGAAGRVAIASLIGAIGFLTLADAAWAHAIGIACLVAFALAGFAALAPWQTASAPDPAPEP